MTKKKEWYILVHRHQEGPYSLADLKKDSRMTPDTLVWKKGFQEWVPARFVPEIQQIFKDKEKKPRPLQELHQKEKGELAGEGPSELTLMMQQDPYQFFLWILLFISLLIYAFYQLSR